MDEYLESLDDNITTIDLSCYNLSELPDLTRFNKLKKLDCRDNEITKLNNLPISLQILICGENAITNLDYLPLSLTKLYCFDNKITKLNNLPPT